MPSAICDEELSALRELQNYFFLHVSRFISLSRQCAEPAPNYELQGLAQNRTSSLRKVWESQFQHGRQRKAKALHWLHVELNFGQGRHLCWSASYPNRSDLRLRHCAQLQVGNLWHLAMWLADVLVADSFGLMAVEVGSTVGWAFKPKHSTRAMPPIRIPDALAMGALEVSPGVPQIIMALASLLASSFGPEPAARTS